MSLLRSAAPPLSLLSLSVGLCVGLGLHPATAHAQQPLRAFLDAARAGSLDARASRAAARQAGSRVDEARARLLPSASARGVYTRNEFEAALTIPGTTTMVTIQPFDQLSFQGQLVVPILDVSAWAQYFATEAAADAAGAQVDATQEQVEAAVVQGWHQVVAARALISAATANLEATERNLEVANARVDVGAASPLERSRAAAEVARAQQSLAEAELQARLAERQLADLTQLEPSGEVQAIEVELTPQPPLARFLSAVDDRPAVRAARARRRSTGILSDTAWTALLPTIVATATETGSNVGGFTGQNWSYALSVIAEWRLDFARPAQINTTAAQADAAAVEAERVEQQARTSVYEAWHRAEASLAAARAARVAEEASAQAVEDVRATFEAGAATQLDVLQAERDLFRARVATIQALANLRVAQVVLRIRAGLDAGA